MAENLTDTNVGNIEYIRKEDASDAVIKHLRLDYEYAWGVREAINSLPSADVVSIVRCGQCGYWHDNDGDYGYCYAKDGQGFGHAWGKNDFCSYGERKGEYFCSFGEREE